MFPPPFVLSTEKRQNRSLTQDVTPFLNNIIFQHTNPPPFETEPHTIHTIPLARKHCDSYLYYIRYKTLEIPLSQKPFLVKGITTGTYYRTIQPQNITLSIQDVFLTYMEKLIEFNGNQDTPLDLPSHLEDLKHRSEYFVVPDLETRIQRHDNLLYWLQKDISQARNLQYRFFNNITLTDYTIPQVKVFTQCLLKFFRFNHQLLWEQQDQQAYIHFPQILTQTELLPYIIKNEHRHLQYRDPTSFNTTYFNQINRDHNFITVYSETSVNRSYNTSNISPETTPEEQTSNVVPQYIRQHSVQSEQEDLANFFQNQEPHQLNPLYPQLPQASDIQQLNPSETATKQNASEFSDETVQTVQNTQSLTITNDSNLIQVNTHNITQDETNNQNQDNTLSTTQDNTSILSTSHTNVTQPSQAQISRRQINDPRSFPPQFPTQIPTHNSPQQSSSNTQSNTIVQLKVIQYKMYKLV